MENCTQSCVYIRRNILKSSWNTHIEDGNWLKSLEQKTEEKQIALFFPAEHLKKMTASIILS